MNALTIAVAVLSTAVTLSAAEAAPNTYVSYKNPSTCRSAEPSSATLDRPDTYDEGCTCSGSWQPYCCCPRPRPYGLPPCRQPCTCRPPSCGGPPATEPAPYQAVSYSPWPTASTSCPDLPCSAPSPGPRPCPAAAPVPAPAPARLCTCSPSTDQPPCPYCARLRQPLCPAPPPSVSGLSSADLAEFMSPSAPCTAATQRPQLPKLIPVALKPLSFGVHRPSAPYRVGLQGYGGSAPSLLSPFGCGSAPSPYEFYNNK